jgi:cytochrome P450
MSDVDMTDEVKQPVELSPPTDKPEHVPESLVYDFDYNADPAYLKNPHARVVDLMEKAPSIFWTPRNGGHWVVLSYEAMRDAFANHQVFSSEHFPPELFETMMASLPEDERLPAPIPICLDPPKHTKLRAPLVSTFGPKGVMALKGTIRALAERLVDAIADKGHCEFMTEVADLYPVEIFLNMFGLPLEHERKYRALAKEQLAAASNDPVFVMNMLRNIASVMRDTILDRQTNRKDDMISLLWAAEIDGEPMTFDIMQSYCAILFIAGLDTVVNAMGFGVRHLADNPDLQDELRGNPNAISNATSELLRCYAFVGPMRLLKQDYDFYGVHFKQGDTVQLFTPAAGYDASVFPQPHVFAYQRNHKAMMAFGGGAHYCLGAHLARLELETIYDTMLNRLPRFRLDPDHPPVFHGGIIAGVSSLHLVWDR